MVPDGAMDQYTTRSSSTAGPTGITSTLYGAPTCVGTSRSVTSEMSRGAQQPHPGGPVGKVGGRQRTLGDQPGLGFGGDVGLVAVAPLRAGLVGMARLGIDRGDDSVLGDLASDPPGARPLAWLDILAGDQRQQRHRLGLLGVQVDLGDRSKHHQRVAHQPRHQRLGGLRVIPGTAGLARPVIVVGGQPDPAGLRDQPPHPTDGRDQLGDGVLGGHRVLQERGIQYPPPPTLQHPVCSTTWRTTSKIRRGRGEARSRARQYTSTVGWKPSSSSRSPQATFQAMSRRSALIASRSLRPSSACSTITVATTWVGTDGWLRPWTTRSANSSGGNSCWRWSARKAYTDPSGTRWRHQLAASNWLSGGWLEGPMPGSLPAANPSANYRIGTTNRIGRTTPVQRPPRS
jgi:hypothetical protein